MNRPFISLCMIVRDEAERIERCLSSVSGIVDEIIVVDTGSVDDTKNICLRWGAKLIDYIWADDFSAARNMSLAHATGQWILWLDADEELDKETGRYLSTLLREGYAEEKLVCLQVCNYVDASEDVTIYQLAQARLIKNGEGARFVRAIHEMLHLEEAEVGLKKPLAILPIQVHHYGYTSQIVEEKQKHKRNLSLLLAEKERNNERRRKGEQLDTYELWCDYHLASEYYRSEDYEQAFQYINGAIKVFLEQQKQPSSMIYRLKYEILYRHGSMRGAFPGIELAVRMFPDYVDLHFLKGVFYYEHELYQEALRSFEHCLSLGEECWHHLSCRSMGGDLAFKYIGMCLEKMHKHISAQYFHQLAASL